jgi:hypothetical protein
MMSAPERVRQVRPRWVVLGATDRERLTYEWVDVSVRLLGPLFRRFKNPDAAGVVEALPPIRDCATLARARAVVMSLARRERRPSRLQEALLSTSTFLTALERDANTGHACLFVVMASRHHFGDDRFFDAVMRPLLVTT